MVENIKKDAVSGDYDSSKIEYEIQKVLLSQIALNPGERARQESGEYKNHPKYIGIKTTMNMFGQYHTITLRKKGDKYHLLGGFIRFCIALELNWDDIEAKVYFNISDYDAIIIEITENTNRLDFTSYELIMAIGKAKEIWEDQYPFSGRGKYNRDDLRTQSITASHAVIPPKKNEKVSGFVTSNYKILGMAERTLYNKVRLYEAIKNKTLDEKNIILFKNQQISYQKLLDKLQKIENKQIIQDKLKKSFEDSKNQKLINYIAIEEGSPDNIIQKFDGAQNIKQSFLERNVNRKDKINPKNAVIKESEDNLCLHETEKKIRKKELASTCSLSSINKENSENEQDIKPMKCKSCSLAHLIVGECYHCDLVLKCGTCGKTAFIVFCKRDINQGRIIPKNPNAEICLYSPEFNVELKNEIN